MIAEYIVTTEKPVDVYKILYIAGLENFAVKRMEKHGRLIDADKLVDDFYVHLTVTSPYMQRSVVDQMAENVRLASQMAPTVLEATE